MSVPPEESGNHILTESERQSIVENVINTHGAGIMIWTTHRQTERTDLIDLSAIVENSCRQFRVANPSQICAP